MQHRANYRGSVNVGCSCCSGDRVEQLPDPFESEICNGKTKRKKSRPKKEKCPINRVHEWYKEEIPNPDWYSYILDKWVAGEGTFEQWTCIHCWKVHKPRPRHRGWRRPRSRSSYRTRTLVLPKRPVKF